MIKEITLTKEQLESLPYKSTEVSKGKTYGEIIGLLETHGIKDYQWTKYQGVDVLSFPFQVKNKDVIRKFLVKLTVPRISAPKRTNKGRGRGPTTITYLEDVSWRIFWWYLKAKLEAVEFGISDEFREFMPDIINKLGDDREVSLKDLILDNADRLDGLAQIEDRRDPRKIDADFRVKE